jgi:hypothetical protein
MKIVIQRLFKTRKTAASWAFCLLAWALSAQVVTVSDELTVQENDQYEIIGKLDDRVLLLVDRNEAVEVHVFDEEMRLKTTRTLDFERKNTDVLAVLCGNKEDFSLVYRFKRKSETHFRVRKYNAQVELIDSAEVKLHKQWDYSPMPQIVPSDDRSKFVMHYEEKYNEMAAISFDLDSMKVLWDNDLRFDDLSTERDGFQTLTTNEGVFYYIFQKDNNRFSRKRNSFVVLKLDASGDQYQRVPVPEKLIFDAYFVFDEMNRQLLGAGLYDDRRLGRAKGYFYLKLPQNALADYLLAFAPFDLALMSTILGKDAKEGDTFYDAVLNEPVLRRDGGLLLSIERRRIVSNGNTFGAPISPVRGTPLNIYTEYNYDDVILAAIHPSGELHWSKVLYKRQNSLDDGGQFSSYFLLKNQTGLRLLYNDDIKSETTVSEYLVGPLGDLARKNTFSTEGKKLELLFSEGRQIAHDEALVPSQHRRWLRLVRVRW